MHAGNLHDTQESARQALAIALKYGAPRLASQSEFFLGLSFYESNDLEAAERHLRAAATNPSCGAIFLTAATARLVFCLNNMGREAESNAIISAFVDRLLESEQQDNVYNFRATLARIAYLRGQYSEALSLIDSISYTPEQTDSRSLEIPWLFKAILLYQRGSVQDVAEADELLARVDSTVGTYRLYQFQLQLLFAKALRDQRHGRDAQAGERVRLLLDRTERSGFVRTILDMGPAANLLIGLYADKSVYSQNLLFQLSNHAEPVPEPSRTWVHAPVQTDPDTLPTYVEPLTEREREILRGLYQRLSNKEIAYDLSISPLTVKTHARNLYSKLGVNSRRQAISRAMELNLLPRP